MPHLLRDPVLPSLHLLLVLEGGEALLHHPSMPAKPLEEPLKTAEGIVAGGEAQGRLGRTISAGMEAREGEGGSPRRTPAPCKTPVFTKTKMERFTNEEVCAV